MEIYNTGNKAINIYNISSCMYDCDCTIDKSLGYLSHIKLHDSHLILVQDHTKILVHVWANVGVRYG